MTSKTKIYKIYNYLIRLVIILSTYSFIYYEIFYHRDMASLWSDFTGRLSSDKANLYILFLAMMMMIANWALETLKWQVLISKIERVSFKDAFKAVLTGISVSFFMPNRTGDYLGRVFILKKANRIEGILITVIGSFSQIIVTLGAGLIALFCSIRAGLIGKDMPGLLHTGLSILIPVLVFLSLLVYYNISFLSAFFAGRLTDRWKKYEHYLSVLSRYTRKELSQVLALSFLRFMVFSSQYYLLLLLLSVKLPYKDALILISLIYLVMLIVPTIALAEIGVRGSVSIYVFGLYFLQNPVAYHDPELAVFSTSTLLWLVNLMIPAILGTFFVYALKFFRK